MSNGTPREIDEQLAALHREAEKLERDVARAQVRVLQTAGARQEYRYGGGGRGWDMSFEDAFERVAGRASDSSPAGRDALAALTNHGGAVDALNAKQAEIDEVASQYTGWSRFFVVTSSTGHIHSSMNCSTCYPTTTFGWLPHLSGSTEVEAVEACGPALCSVCFPSAPVEHQRSSITQQEAEQMAQGKTIAELRAAKDAVKAAKEAKKAEKAARAVERAKKLLAKVEKFYLDNDGYEAVMAWDYHTLYDRCMDLPTTVHDVVFDDWTERNEGRSRYHKDPRVIIRQAVQA